ncbi:MAG: hypothetical protein FWD47_01730 [Treponema sp.]|nr:hypothetical protein [Treponema sp.]
MIFLGVILGIAIMGAVSYMALNKKSSFQIRLVSLIALAVMVLTVIICVIIYFSTGTEVPIDWSTYRVDQPIEVKDESNPIAIILTILFFLTLFVVIAVLAMKEHKKQNKK